MFLSTLYYYFFGKTTAVLKLVSSKLSFPSVIRTNKFGDIVHSNKAPAITYTKKFGDIVHSNKFGAVTYASKYGTVSYKNTFSTVTQK
jgi:uncharacterized protein YlbG (UPF0298 family)